MVITLSGQWLIVLFGIMNTVAMLLLYRASGLGPLSLVVPIIAAHSVIIVLFTFTLGSRPSGMQWLGMALATLGVVIVARAVEQGDNTGTGTKHGKAITLAVCASLAYAVLVIAGQNAVPLHGELQTLWLGRIIAMITMVPFFCHQNRPGRPGPMMA